MKKMTAVIICLTLVCASLLIFSACRRGEIDDFYDGDGYINIIRPDDIDESGGGEPMEFESFMFEERGMSAEIRGTEVNKTENGVHMECYISTKTWNNEISGYEETRAILREVEGGEELYRELCALLGKYGVNEWAGFKGSNPPGALDGSSVSFSAVLADGTKIEAGGTNNFPANYRKFTQAVDDLITTVKLTDTRFVEGRYEITVPESWVGVVTAEFSEGLVAFKVDKIGGGTVTFFIIDNMGQGYTSDDYKGRVEVGRLVSEDEVMFITARDHDDISYSLDKLTQEARAVGENYKRDKLFVIESIRGINGYELIPEDGMTLYENDARQLAEDARSLWLFLNFGGEYGTEKPTRIKGRQYKPMFPRYMYINDIDGVRKELLTVFSEEFTDKIISEAVEKKDLLEYKDDVYVACKKKKGEGADGYRLDHVRNDGGGKFTVVMAVKRPPDRHIEYVELPAERNAAGEFVFTDFPYWDKSE